MTVPPTTPPSLQLSALRIFVHDGAAARHFYRDQLGLALVAEDPAQGWCVFTSRGLQLVVEAVAPDAPEDEQALAGRFTGLSFEVADIQSATVALQARGVFFSALPEPQPWGGWLATFEDPAGNALQLVQHPHPRHHP